MTTVNKASVLVRRPTSVDVTSAGPRWTARSTVVVTITVRVTAESIAVTAAFTVRLDQRVRCVNQAATAVLRQPLSVSLTVDAQQKPTQSLGPEALTDVDITFNYLRPFCPF